MEETAMNDSLSFTESSSFIIFHFGLVLNLIVSHFSIGFSSDPEPNCCCYVHVKQILQHRARWHRLCCKCEFI